MGHLEYLGDVELEHSSRGSVAGVAWSVPPDPEQQTRAHVFSRALPERWCGAQVRDDDTHARFARVARRGLDRESFSICRATGQPAMQACSPRRIPSRAGSSVPSRCLGQMAHWAVQKSR